MVPRVIPPGLSWAALLAILLEVSVIPLATDLNGTTGETRPLPGGLQLEVELEQGTRLGVPTSIEVTLRSTRDLQGVALRLELPTGIQAFGPVSASDLSLNPRGSWQGRFPLTIVGAGDHRIAVSADAPGGIRAYRVLYVNADHSGTYVGDRPLSGLADPSASPVRGPAGASSIEVPNRHGLELKAPSAPQPLGQDEVGLEPQAPGSVVVTGRWSFLNERDVSEPLAGVWVLVWDEDTFSANDLLWSGLTGADGGFTTPALDNSDEFGTLDIYLEVRLQTANTAKVMGSSGSDPWNAFTPTTANVADGTFDAGFWRPSGGDFEAATRIFHQLREGWMLAASLGDDIGAVGARYPSPDGGPHYHPMHTSPYAGEVHIPSGADWDRAADVTVHEHGHYVMDWAYGPFDPSPGGEHSLCEDSQNRGLSWSEGWATAWALFVFNDPVFAWPDGSTASYERADNCDAALTHHDHSEYRVTASLWDLFDAGIDGLDTSGPLGLDEIWRTLKDFNDADYEDFYGSWRIVGYDGDSFLTTAYWNTIDYDVAPTARVLDPNAGGWKRGTITIAASATDSDNLIRYVDFWYTLDGTSFVYLGQDPTSPFSWQWDTTGFNDADAWVRIQSSDGMKTSAFDLSDISFGIDNLPPNTTAGLAGTGGAAGWYRSSVAVTISASDGLSGVDLIQYRTDGGPWQDYRAPILLQADGSYAVEYFSVDIAGNTESSRSTSVNIDTIGPSITILAPGNGSVVGQPSVNVDWSTSDQGSGVSRCTLAVDDGGPVDFPGETTQYFVNLTDGAHRLTLVCWDIAGNSAESTVFFSVSLGLFGAFGSSGTILLVSIVAIAVVSVLLIMSIRRRRARPPGGSPPV